MRGQQRRRPDAPLGSDSDNNCQPALRFNAGGINPPSGSIYAIADSLISAFTGSWITVVIPPCSQVL